MHRLALPLLASLSVSLAATSAGAYCRSTVCKGIDACDGEVIDGCPPLVWASGCVGFSVQDSGGSGLDAGTVELISDLAFDAWRRADCGGQSPGLSIQNLGQVACGAVEYNKDAGNANIVFFSADWPHSEATHTYAITTTTFDPETGDLLSADIELNARDHDFTVNDADVQADLLSVLTHEAGHFLGLGHSGDTEATMFAFYDEGTTELRSLSPDDAAAICAVYPPSASIDDTCNPLPRHGFSPECRDDQTEGSCTATRAGASPNPRLGVGHLLLAALAFATFRARSGRPRRSRSRSG
ncbi:MAG: matrixin family metalloprotease [Polyangiaceae bacterium]|jgi:hypothetical protein|nr:matrixin family metalloprotease [Polyangiaceae bacterium]